MISGKFRLCVDRIEGDKAVCVAEGGEVETLPLATLGHVCEGDVVTVVFAQGQPVSVTADETEKIRRASTARERLEDIFAREKK